MVISQSLAQTNLELKLGFPESSFKLFQKLFFKNTVFYRTPPVLPGLQLYLVFSCKIRETFQNVYSEEHLQTAFVISTQEYYGRAFGESKLQFQQKNYHRCLIRLQMRYLVYTKSTFTFSKLTIETLEKGVKYVQR